MKRLFTIVFLFLTLTVSAQTFQVKTGGEFQTPSEWKNISWTLFDYDGKEMLAYAMPKDGKFKLVRFDDHFNIKNSADIKTEWHVVDISRHNDRIDLFAQTSGKMVYYAIDANTLKLRNQKVLFKYEYWSVGRYEYCIQGYNVQWSPNGNYVGICCYAHQRQDGRSNEYSQTELHLYNSNLEEIVSKEVDYHKYDFDKKDAMRSSRYPAHYNGRRPEIYLTDEGELIYYFSVNELGVFSKEGYKKYTSNGMLDFYNSRFVRKTENGKWLFCTSWGIAAFDPATGNIEKRALFGIKAETERYDFFNCVVQNEEGTKLHVLPCIDEKSTYHLIWLNDNYSEVVARAPMKKEYTYMLTKANLYFWLKDKDDKWTLENSSKNISKYYLSCGNGKLYQIIKNDFHVNSSWYAFSFSQDGNIEVIGKKTVSCSYPNNIHQVFQYDSNHLLVWRKNLGGNPKRPSQRLDIVCIE